MADKLNLDYDNDYEVSDSEEEYTQRERNLLRKVRKGKKRDDSDEEEVFKFENDESEDVEEDSEPEKFEADSDFDEEKGGEEDYLPDSRSWGKKKSVFYNTDFHDNDFSTYTEKEEEIANLEQQEALEIQKRLASELNETDFNLDMFVLPSAVAAQDETKIKKTKTDLSDLSRKQKLALFKAEAPEFDGLVQDFHDRMSESKDLLMPTIELLNSIDFPKHPFVDFVRCRNELILNYCTNISFYLMLKAKRVKVKNHPIVKRLVQFRQLISQLDDIFEYVIQPQIEVLLSETREDDDGKSGKKLIMLENLKSKVETAMQLDDDEEDEAQEISINKPLFKQNGNNSESDDDEEDGNEQMEEIDEKGRKRQITRQIAKNKGLTATKRRELRNPRVKNKIKFNKAVKRRKGAVQPMRTKVDLYGGEATGIKTHLKRSVKIK